MDPWLARIYGTDGGEDLEKTAQYMLLEKLAEEEGVDLSGASPEQIDSLAQTVSQQAAMGQQPTLLGDQQGQEQEQMDPEIMAAVEQLRAQGMDDTQIEQVLQQHFAEQEQMQGGGQQQMDPQMQQEMIQKEAQAKFAEADFLGRVMAHAYFDESRSIVKEADAKTIVDAPGKLRNVGRYIASLGRKGAHGVAEGGRAVGRGAVAGGKAVGRAGQAVGTHVAKNKAYYIPAGAAAAGVAAGAGGHALLSSDKTKTAGEVAVEALAEARAIEILRANGYNV